MYVYNYISRYLISNSIILTIVESVETILNWSNRVSSSVLKQRPIQYDEPFQINFEFFKIKYK